MKYPFAIIVIFLLVSCAESHLAVNDVTSDNAPEIVIAETSSTNFEEQVKLFSDADWLFSNFFGGIAISEDFKIQLEPEIKRIANGFALAYQQKKLDSVVMAKFIVLAKNMKKDFIASTLTPSSRPKVSPPPPADLLPQETNDTNEDDTVYIKHDPIFEAYQKEQQAIAERYNLPYKFPGDTRPFTDIILLTKFKKGDDTIYLDGNIWGKHNHGEYWRWTWRTGDLIFGTNASENSIKSACLQGYWCHVGMVLINADGLFRIIDAMPKGSDNNNGRYDVDYAAIERFRHGYGRLAASRINTSDYIRSAAAWYATTAIGLPYTLVTRKGQNLAGGAYCSLLVWEAYYQATGYLDIDKDQGFLWDAFVTPDDIYYSPLNNVWRVNND